MTNKLTPEWEKEARSISVFATDYIRRATSMAVNEREWLQNVIIEKINYLVSQQLTSFSKEVEGVQKQVCHDEEVHCDYSCHVCGGVKEFLTKYDLALSNLKQKWGLLSTKEE